MNVITNKNNNNKIDIKNFKNLIFLKNNNSISYNKPKRIKNIN